MTKRIIKPLKKYKKKEYNLDAIEVSLKKYNGMYPPLRLKRRPGDYYSQ